MKSSVLFCFSILLPTFCFSTFAAAPAALSLDSLIEEAVDHNPERAYYESEIAAAQGRRTQAGKLANPDLGFEVGRKTSRESGLYGEGTAWAVTLTQTFEWPGRLGLRRAIANHDVKLAELGLERFTSALRARVRLLGFQVSAAREREAAAREVAERFQALRQVLVQRDVAGITPKLELRVIEATTLTLRRSAANAALERRKAVIEINQLLGRPPSHPLEIKAVFPPLKALPEVAELNQRAAERNFDLRIRTVELEQQGFHVALARNERFPTVSIGPMISREKAAADERIAGVGISIPLPLWNRNEGNIAAAQARQRQAEASLKAAVIEVEQQIATACAIHDARREEIEDWKPESITAFREAAALADEHYRSGAVPAATYLELQQKYLEAVDTLLEAQEEALEARLKIEELTGSPLGAKGKGGKS